ncbi:hypothetical protein N9X85_05020 [Luminiphilus sp.]|nr:hypothetical protein [Luminiphilus sp.]
MYALVGAAVIHISTIGWFDGLISFSLLACCSMGLVFALSKTRLSVARSTLVIISLLFIIFLILSYRDASFSKLIEILLTIFAPIALGLSLRSLKKPDTYLKLLAGAIVYIYFRLIIDLSSGLNLVEVRGELYINSPLLVLGALGIGLNGKWRAVIQFFAMLLVILSLSRLNMLAAALYILFSAPKKIIPYGLTATFMFSILLQLAPSEVSLFFAKFQGIGTEMVAGDFDSAADINTSWRLFENVAFIEQVRGWSIEKWLLGCGVPCNLEIPIPWDLNGTVFYSLPFTHNGAAWLVLNTGILFSLLYIMFTISYVNFSFAGAKRDKYFFFIFFSMMVLTIGAPRNLHYAYFISIIPLVGCVSSSKVIPRSRFKREVQCDSGN